MSTGLAKRSFELSQSSRAKSKKRNRPLFGTMGCGRGSITDSFHAGSDAMHWQDIVLREITNAFESGMSVICQRSQCVETPDFECLQPAADVPEWNCEATTSRHDGNNRRPVDQSTTTIPF